MFRISSPLKDVAAGSLAASALPRVRRPTGDHGADGKSGSPDWSPDGWRVEVGHRHGLRRLSYRLDGVFMVATSPRSWSLTSTMPRRSPARPRCALPNSNLGEIQALR